ncbi:MFS transporter [Bradyrhizobium liaoningense]
MQLHGEPDLQVSDVDVAVPKPRKRRASPTRKVTVRLSTELCERLEVATDRPGVGKSMIIDAALDRFLNPAASLEGEVRERFDGMYERFDRLERNMQMMAETVSLHARYQLAVMPPVPQSRQHEAILLGDERFKVLAEQVDRRVRQGRPLMQETIDRLKVVDEGMAEPVVGRETPPDPAAKHSNQGQFTDAADAERASLAAAGKGDGNSRSPSIRMDSNGGRGVAGNKEQNPQPALRDPNPEWLSKLEVSQKRAPSTLRLILSVFLPFAAGYYLAYLFRTINAAIAPALSSDFGIDAAQMGLLASVYFLVFGFAQIPIGTFLDRFGPRRVQGVLLVIAAGGATLFGTASSFPELLVARAMIGLGVAGSLMAGLKAIVTWFPRERVAFANGWMIMLGSLGAVTATAPAEYLLEVLGWRNLFEVLTIATVVAGGLIYMVVPEPAMGSEAAMPANRPLTLWSIYSDSRFLRVAPLSAACIGSSWALHSLWASAWLGDVEGLDQQDRVGQLFLMAVGLSLGALLLGTMADRLRKHNVRTEVLLAGAGALFIAAELALVMRVPLPSLLPWSVVSIAGAATVLSFAAVAEYFPSEFAARANGALNLLHFGWAFVVQYGIGLVVGQWPSQDGHYPIAAYQTAFGLSLALQAAALLWFTIPWFRTFGKHFHLSVAQESTEHSRQAEFVAAPVEGPILDTRHATEW